MRKFLAVFFNRFCFIGLCVCRDDLQYIKDGEVGFKGRQSIYKPSSFRIPLIMMKH